MSEIPFKGITLRSETITKRSRYLRIWRRRRLVLTSTYLIAIDDNNNNKITEDIDLFTRPIAHCAANDLNNPCAFKIEIRNQRMIYIIAENRESKQAWISAIETAATFCYKYYWTYLMRFGTQLPVIEGAWQFDVTPEDSPENVKEKYFKKLLELSKDNKDEKNDFIADCYLNLGMVYQGARDFDKSLKCCFNSLTVLKSVFGEKHLKVGEMYDILGQVSSVLGQHEQAVDYFKTAVGISETVNGKYNEYTLEYYLDLADEYVLTQEYAKSHDCAATAEEILRMVYVQVPEKWSQRMKSLKDSLAGH